MDNVTPIRRVAAVPEPLWRECVGEQLRCERLDRDLRLVDVAERAGVSPQYLSEVERGVKDPSSEVLSAVAGALRISVRELATRAARRPVPQGQYGTHPHHGQHGPVCFAA